MDNKIIKKISNNYENYTDTYKAIADVILKFDSTEHEKFNLTIKEFAEQAYCASSTIIQFIKTVGYNSYGLFKHDLNNPHKSKDDSLIRSLDIVNDFIVNNQELFDNLTNDIIHSKKIFFFSALHSRICVLDFTLKFQQINEKIFFEFDQIQQEKLVHHVTPDDLVIIVSNCGNCKILNDIANRLNPKAKYLITNRYNSLLSKKVDSTICIDNHLDQLDTFLTFPKESKYSLMNFFDNLFERILELQS
ncbi:MAG: MurR/RpiR family transcriptional regulator [Mycoplasmatales bacterium]